MFKHLWVERSYYLAKPKKKVDSTLAADIVPNVFAGEGEEGEEETIGGLYHSGWKFFRYLALEFLSQNTNTRMRIRNIRMYTYIYINTI